MTEEKKTSMEDMISQAKEGLDEQENVGQTEDPKHQDSKEEVQEENSEPTEKESGKNTDTTPILRAISTAEKIDRALPQVTGLDGLPESNHVGSFSEPFISTLPSAVKLPTVFNECPVGTLITLLYAEMPCRS